ncbi:NTP transferase domain-containing protein [Mesorhizobium australicum]|uniref:Molybdopterin molybdochelatase /molybdenum cofactor cytidylyltransferase n=1 Tax=Mesorhizobium australicum TaxID=536018 RepID=A0A1X7PEF0_9HYPH|nr:molybdopterin-binding/glycosyltransferase family 2 protein [Mesorhizobium australicum]SMH49096.1 molybdopterin molybdochelatase /molybdenum cofactor cytidylyltransferase [Mesorhizobium australicum]
MRFGPIALGEAEGAILAHSTSVGDVRLRKSHRLTGADVAALRAAGMSEVIAAVLDADDVAEDEAARRVSAALTFSGIVARAPATGRVNLHAQAAGVFTADKTLIDAINRVDPAVTIATVPDHAAVAAGQMVATVKIIPFAVSEKVLATVERLAQGGSAFDVHPFAARRVGLIQTVLPSLKASVMDKTGRITAGRLRRSGSSIVGEERVAHREDALAPAIEAMAARADMLLIFGASAMCDPNDVIPAAIRAAGGEVLAAGMPVDPGNLLVLGRLGGRPVLGAPGCARSPKENGFDWVLDRLMAGLDVTADEIAGMGVGGLLMEIATRPEPRERPVPAARTAVHAVVLAAGRSSRMGGPNKLLALFHGEPLVRRVAEGALASEVAGVTVVTGHQAERVRAALDGLGVSFAANPDFATGLASSLKAGIGALPDEAAGALILLADMPEIEAGDLDRLIDAFRRSGGRAIVRATHEGKRGNPVILPRAVFAEVARIEGDTGARHVIEAGVAEVLDVELGRSASLDVDTPEALMAAGGALQD